MEQVLSDSQAYAGAPSPQPSVSVVMTVYNHARYVKESLSSVASSVYPVLEIIVIDDASKDESDSIIQQWIREHRDHPITYIRHEQNRGLTKTLNELISMARGELIFFNSGDDVILEEGIEKLADYLASNPNKLAVFADCHVIDRDSKQLHESGIEGLHRRSGMRKSMLEIDSILRFSIFYHWGVCGPGFMMRKETCSLVGPYDEELALDDWDMYLRLASIGKLGFYNGYTGQYRLHGKNSIVRHRSRLIRDAVHVGRKHAHNFGGIPSLRIAGLSALFQYCEAKSRLLKLFYFFESGTLLFISNYIHRAMRLILLLSHKYLIRCPSTQKGRDQLGCTHFKIKK